MRSVSKANPYNVQVGDIYQSNDTREGWDYSQNKPTFYEQPAFTVIAVDATHATVSSEPDASKPRRIRLDRFKPTGRNGYRRISP